MKFGICVYTEDIPSAERAGYDYVELTVTNVVPEVDESQFRVLKSRLRGSDIRPEAWRRFLPSSRRVVGPGVDFNQMTEYLKTTLGRIGELGGRVVVFGSPGARRIPEGFSRETARSQMIEFLHVAADKAAQNGITIVIEPILKRNCNALNSVHDAVALAKAVNRREVKVLADLFHMTSENETVEAVREAGEDLQHVHLPVPDLPGLSEPREVFENLPHYPIESFLAELRGLHYQHRISVEDLDRKFMNLEREGPLVLAYLSKMWKQMAQ